MPFRKFVVITLPAMLLATPALAQQAGGPPPGVRPDPQAWPADRVTIGLGGGIGPDYSGSDDYRFQPGGVVQGSVSGFAFAMRGTNFYVDLVREKQGARSDLIAGPVVQLRSNRSGKIADPRVAALGKRKTAVELGGYVGYGKRGVFSRFDELSADVAVVQDVAGSHRSLIVTPSLGYSTVVGGKSFALVRMSADFVGKGYAQSYFDVPVGATLQPYSTGGGGLKSIALTGLLTRDFGGDPRTGFSLFGLASYSRITGKFAKSPVVAVAGSPNQALGVVGLGYSF